MFGNVRFEVSIVVDGRPYEAGDIAPATDIPSGCLEVLRRLRQVVDTNTPLRAVPPPPAIQTELTRPVLHADDEPAQDARPNKNRPK